ncbi:hypothetical protein GCM10023334_096520 [Nonomuraea thailandensis]
MMTFDACDTLKPHPEMVAPELPMTVLFEVTRSMPEQEIVPETLITAAEPDDRALVRAEAEETVVAGTLPPPVVPPPCVAQPTSGVSAAAGAEAAAVSPAAAAATLVRRIRTRRDVRMSVLLPTAGCL